MGENRPAIKGTGFGSAVADVESALESGELTSDQLEARLQAEDLQLLKAKVLPGDWYPISTYGRVLDLLCEAVGRGSLQYHVMRGRRAAERLTSSGIYHQLDKALQIKEGTRSDWQEGAARVMLTMTRALFNFMEWRYERDPERAGAFAILVTGAEAFPEAGRHTIQGVIEYATEAIAGGEVHVESSRPHPGELVFRVTASG
jgi:hypothetical protein